jgi:purine catabolism regulator
VANVKPTERRVGSESAHPTIVELVSQRDLRLNVLLGSDAALGRRIRWIHSTELVDPSQYLRGGELVCTVGTNLLDTVSCAKFVKALAAVDAAGVCFGLGDVHQSPPPALIDSCRRAELPLIEIPYGVLFLALSEFVASYRADVESEKSAQGERLVASLLADVRNERPPEELITLTANALAGSIVLSLADDVVGSTPESPGQLTLEAKFDPSEPDPARRVEASIGERIHIYWEGAGEPPSIDLLTQVGRVLDLAVTERERASLRERQRIGYLLSLVGDGTTDAIAVVPYLEHAGLSSSTLVVSAWPGPAAPILARHLGSSALVGETPEVAYVISRGDTQVAELALSLGLTCGYGPTHQARFLARGIAEARICLNLARRYGRPIGPHELTSIEGLLEQQPRGRLLPFVEQLIEPLHSYDTAHGANLVETLATFIRFEGSPQATARALYIHVNTVRFRLGRIKDLTGRDATGLNDRMAFVVAMWADERRVANGPGELHRSGRFRDAVTERHVQRRTSRPTSRDDV